MYRASGLAVLATVALAGCDQGPATKADIAALTARVSKLESAKPAATLSVTWLVTGQPPETTQSTYRTLEECEAARARAVAAGDQTIAARRQQNATDKAEALESMRVASERARQEGAIISGFAPGDVEKLKGQPVPSVTAVCL